MDSNLSLSWLIGCIKSNVTSQSDFHRILMRRLFGQVISPFLLLTSTKRAQFSLSSPHPSRFQVDSLIEHGARQFVFLTVPPTNRAPLLIDQGPQVVSSISAALADYNKQLVANVKSLPLRHRGVTASIFDTRPIFNTLLDNVVPSITRLQKYAYTRVIIQLRLCMY